MRNLRVYEEEGMRIFHRPQPFPVLDAKDKNFGQTLNWALDPKYDDFPISYKELTTVYEFSGFKSRPFKSVWDMLREISRRMFHG